MGKRGYIRKYRQAVSRQTDRRWHGKPPNDPPSPEVLERLLHMVTLTEMGATWPTYIGRPKYKLDKYYQTADGKLCRRD